MSPLTVRLSDSAGFCWGVERALQLTLEAAEDAAQPVQTLGPLIHNPGVIAELSGKGVTVLADAEEAREGTVILRSHGVPRDVKQRLADTDLNLVDATCPFVTSAQEKAAGLHQEGYLVIILGDKDHPEVAALRSYAGEASLVVQSPADLPARLPSRRIGVVVQTTQSPKRLSELAADLAPRVKELLVHNTICNATEQRQAAAERMAAEVDAVVVVGGRDSGNTLRLAELCHSRQPNTHHVESATEIDPRWFRGVQVVGVTAGASTPSEQIEAVLARIREVQP
jgi:(E)-4-hydroxy-3-methyl-but-2-enyl pyrophosphate reductase